MHWPWISRRRDEAPFNDTQDLLRRYALSRDGMTARELERQRATILAAFEAQAASRPQWSSPRRAPRRLALVLATVAVLALAGTVAAAESGPGQPFYGVRLTIESMTLPAEGSARTEALLALLNRRLDEASRESEHGNDAGVADAVRAYLSTLEETRGRIGPGASQTAVEAGLQRHVTVLESIAGSAPPDVQGGLQQAIRQAEAARHALEEIPDIPAQPGPPSRPGPPLSPPGRP